MTARPVSLRVAPVLAGPLFARHGEPVSVGVDFPRGAVQPTDAWAVRAPNGQVAAAQTTTLDCWGDGSVRWMLVDFRADAAEGSADYLLEPRAAALSPPAPLKIDHTDDRT